MCNLLRKAWGMKFVFRYRFEVKAKQQGLSFGLFVRFILGITLSLTFCLLGLLCNVLARQYRSRPQSQSVRKTSIQFLLVFRPKKRLQNRRLHYWSHFSTSNTLLIRMKKLRAPLKDQRSKIKVLKRYLNSFLVRWMLVARFVSVSSWRMNG